MNRSSHQGETTDARFDPGGATTPCPARLNTGSKADAEEIQLLWFQKTLTLVSTDVDCPIKAGLYLCPYTPQGPLVVGVRALGTGTV